MTKYVIYREFGKLRLTNEPNFNAYICNASQVIDVNNFKDAEAVKQYLINEWKLLPSQIIIVENSDKIYRLLK